MIGLVMVQVADLSHENFKSSRAYEVVTLSTFISFWCQSDLLSLQYKENKSKFADSNGRLKAKSFSASGGLRPLTPWPGALPLDPAGGSAPRPPL